MEKDLKSIVFKIVSAIPAGQVMTYCEVAKLAGTGARVVGNILHKNNGPENIPCHRVIHADGTLSQAYKFGGEKAQYQKLSSEGVKFKGVGVVFV